MPKQRRDARKRGKSAQCRALWDSKARAELPRDRRRAAIDKESHATRPPQQQLINMFELARLKDTVHIAPSEFGKPPLTAA